MFESWTKPFWYSVFGSGAQHPGSATLLEFMGNTLREAKVQMRVFAENMLTGEVATGVEDSGASASKSGGDAPEGQEDFSGELEKVNCSLRFSIGQLDSRGRQV